MGTTPKKLTFLTTPEIASWPEFQALAAQGHKVLTALHGLDWPDIDIIFAPQAWRMNQDVRPFLELAIKEARKSRYPSSKTKGT